MRSKLFLMLAIIMGLVTSVLFYNYMKQFDTEAIAYENTVEVLVAKQVIQKNQKLSTEMVQIQKVPEKNLHPQVVRNVSEIEGKYATAAMQPGEILLSHRIKAEKEETLFVSRKIREGYRAVSIGVNFVQSVSNLIEPEDMVDVVFSEQIKASSGTEPQVVSKMLWQKVRVLAVGRRMIESVDGQPFVEYSSVTLELKPDESVNLIQATQKGSIQLVLHTKVIPPKEGEAHEQKSK